MADDEVTGGEVKRRSTYTPPPEGAEFPERLGELSDDDIARAKKASEAASLAQESVTPEPSPESATYLPSTPFEAPAASEQVSATTEQPSHLPEPEATEPVTETVVGNSSPQAPVVSESAPEVGPDVSPGEPVIPPAPTRTSLDDQQIMAQFYDGDSPSTETLMAALESQLDLRAQEDARFDQWAAQIRTLLPAAEADTLISQSRRHFDGLPPMSEPEQEPLHDSGEEPGPHAEVERPEESEETPEGRDEQVHGDPLLASLVTDTADITTAEPATPSAVASAESAPSTAVFDDVISDPDAASPATAAWPLVDATTEQELPDPAPAANGPIDREPDRLEESDSAAESAGSRAEGEVEDDDVVVPALADSGISVGTETLSIKQAVATREIPAEPFIAVTVEKERWFSFDRSGVEPSPEMNRTARGLQLFWTWWSVTVPLGGLLLGAWLTQDGVSFVGGLLAATLGVLIGALPLVVGTLQGARTGLPTLIMSRQTFGLWGNVLPAVIAVVTRIAVGAFFLWAGVWVATQVYVEANLWTSDPGPLSVIVATAAAVVVGALVIAGRHWVSLMLWVSGGLSLVAGVLLVVLTWELPTASALDRGPLDGAALVSGASFVAAVMLILWSQSGGDIARFHAPGPGRAASVAVGFAAVIPPIVVITWGLLLGASEGGVGEALIQSPLETLLGLAPDWYPVPALILLAAPLLGLGALALHSSSYAVMSVGVAIPRFASAAVVSVVAAAAVFAVILTVDNLGALVPGLVVFLGVPAAAWVGAVVGDFVTRRAHPSAAVLLATRGAYPAVRVAPLIGFVAAIGVGWGFVDAEGPGLSWTGYLSESLARFGAIDLSAWQLGIAGSLLLAFAVASLAGIRGGALDGTAREEK